MTPVFSVNALIYILAIYQHTVNEKFSFNGSNRRKYSPFSPVQHVYPSLLSRNDNSTHNKWPWLYGVIRRILLRPPFGRVLQTVPAIGENIKHCNYPLSLR